MVVRTEKQWIDLLNKHEASGLSAAEFCRENKLNRKYFSLRKKQLLNFKKPGDDFIKVSVSKSEVNFIPEYDDLKLS